MAVRESALTEAAVHALSERYQEPDWLARRRLEAWRLYLETPLPSAKEEAWRRTDVSTVDLDGIIPFAPGALATTDAELPPAIRWAMDAGDGHLAAAPGKGEQGPRGAQAAPAPTDETGGLVVQHNSTLALHRLRDDLARRGVVFGDIHTGVREQPELVRKWLMTQVVKPEESKFTLLHLALMSGGVFLYVPRNVEIEVPLQALVYADAERLGLFNHTLVIADVNSRVTFIERYESADLDRQAVHSGVVELVALPGSQIRYGGLQNLGRHYYSFTVRRARVERDAQVDWVTGEFGGDLARSEVTSHIWGEGGQSYIYNVFFGNGQQHLDVATAQVHMGRNQQSDILGRGVLNDRARSVYRGLGQIMPGASGGKTFQRQQTLVLSDRARADSIPGLLIDENDVLQAGHAATVGQVDREQLFYLMSRGIPRQRAIKLIIDGFMAPLLDRLPVEAVRREIEHLIEWKMGLAPR